MMTIEEQKQVEELAEKIKNTEQALEKKLPKWTWLWRIIGIIALILGAYANIGCTYSQTTTKTQDAESKTTIVQWEQPDLTQLVKYRVPTVQVGK